MIVYLRNTSWFGVLYTGLIFDVIQSYNLAYLSIALATSFSGLLLFVIYYRYSRKR